MFLRHLRRADDFALRGKRRYVEYTGLSLYSRILPYFFTHQFFEGEGRLLRTSNCFLIFQTLIQSFKVVLNWEGYVRNKVTLGTSMVRVAFDADIRIEGNLLAISLMLFYFLVSHANGQTVWNSQQQPDMFTKKKGNHNTTIRHFYFIHIFLSLYWVTSKVWDF